MPISEEKSTKKINHFKISENAGATWDVFHDASEYF